MSANYYHLPGGGSESRPLYPMSWSEGGREFMYDGDIEHIPHDVLPPGLRSLYRASIAARRKADDARWQEFVMRKRDTMTNAWTNAWTPGPWFAHGKLGKSLQHGVTAGKPYNQSVGAVRRIAKCGSPYPSRTPELDAEDEANARLIAAAPDMAEALDELIASSDDYDETSAADRRCTKAIEFARAALAKARGEAP